LDYTVNERIQVGQGNRVVNAAPHGAYRCRGDDRWCAIAVYSEEEWRRFCGVLGNPPWTMEERFTTLVKRKENEDDLDQLVEAWTMERNPEQVTRLMQAEGVAAGVVETGEDILLHDEQIKARDYFVTLDHPAGNVLCENTTIMFSETPSKVRRAGPTMGQDNEYVYGEILGMPEEEINQYYVDGVFD
jgi:benzylsuccinate CoA-transferase BbsF subunit